MDPATSIAAPRGSAISAKQRSSPGSLIRVLVSLVLGLSAVLATVGVCEAPTTIMFIDEHRDKPQLIAQISNPNTGCVFTNIRLRLLDGETELRSERIAGLDI